MRKNEPSIGILALQGSFQEHQDILFKTTGIKGKLVRNAESLESIDGIIIPGGESTTLRILMDKANLKQPLIARIQKGMPVWGTCAGTILLAKTIEGENPYLGLMDVTVQRNAYGSQLDSFEALGQWSLKQPSVGRSMRFIRAPRFVSWGVAVEPIALCLGMVVGVLEKNMLATAFHPELTTDAVPYQWLVSKALEFTGAS